jgi:hypothetical protein
MYLNSEHYSCPTEGKAIAHVMAEKKSAKSQEYRYIQECRKKRHKAKQSRRKANTRLKNQMRNQNDQFILTWKPDDNSRN